MRNKLFKLAVMTCKLTLKVSWLLVNYGVQFTVWCFVMLLTMEKKTPKKQRATKQEKTFPLVKYHGAWGKCERCINSAGDYFYRPIHLSQDNEPGLYHVQYLHGKFAVRYDDSAQAWRFES